MLSIGMCGSIKTIILIHLQSECSVQMRKKYTFIALAFREWEIVALSIPREIEQQMLLLL